MAKILEAREDGASFILEADKENPELVYKYVCQTNCPFFKTYCEGMANHPQGLKTAKLNSKKITTRTDAERLAENAPC